MSSWVRGIIDRLFVVAGALALSQAPLYIQQYTQQLSGHVAELRYQVQNLEVAAAESNKSLPEYIQKFSGNADQDIARQGAVMRGMVERLRSFKDALSSLQEASLYVRPFLFIAHFNRDVAASTWKNFEYGLSFSEEGIAYALLGAVMGYLTFALLALPFKWAARKFAAKRASAAV